MDTKNIRYMLIASVFLVTSSGVVSAAGDATAGGEKAAQCSSCHGANGEGAGENPKIAGMEQGAFIKAMNAYKSGERKNMMMEMFAKKLSDQDIADLATFYVAK